MMVWFSFVAISKAETHQGAGRCTLHDRSPSIRKRVSCLEFSLSLSRACLGKTIIFGTKWRKKPVFSYLVARVITRPQILHQTLTLSKTPFPPQLFPMFVPSLSWQKGSVLHLKSSSKKVFSTPQSMSRLHRDHTCSDQYTCHASEIQTEWSPHSERYRTEHGWSPHSERYWTKPVLTLGTDARSSG